MNRSHPLRLGAAVGACMLLAACSDATGPTDDLTEEELQELAVVAADAAIEEVALMRVPLSLFGFVATGAAHGGHDPMSPRHAVRSVTFLDAAGNAQDRYDPATTASVVVEMSIAGEVVRGAWSTAFSRERTLTISGLEGEETTRTFDGEGSESFRGSVDLGDRGVRAHESEGAFTIDGVVVPVRRLSDAAWPLSGTIHREWTATLTGPRGERTRSIDATITFDGDSTASGVINGHAFEIDLAAGAGRNPLRRWLGRR